MEPTDDELLAIAKEHGVAPTYWTTRLHLVDMLRRAIETPTRDDAEQLLIGDSGDPMPVKLASSLRSRFPQPITDAVLRGEGFGQTDFADLGQVIGGAPCEAFRQDAETWGITIGRQTFYVRTPDRLHRVVECLRELYAPREDA